MFKLQLTSLHDKYLYATEEIIHDYPDIFSAKDYENYRLDLLGYLIQKPHKKQSDKIIIATSNDNAVIGVVVFGPENLADSYWKIKWLLVKKEYQNKGIGKELIKNSMRLIKQNNGSFIVLETSNEHHNDRVKHFYESLGFKPYGIMPSYYPHPINRKRKEDNILYLKEI